MSRKNFVTVIYRGFPDDGWVVKSRLADAGDTGSISGPGGSHMPWGQLNPGTTEPVLESSGATSTEACEP